MSTSSRVPTCNWYGFETTKMPSVKPACAIECFRGERAQFGTSTFWGATSHERLHPNYYMSWTVAMLAWMCCFLGLWISHQALVGSAGRILQARRSSIGCSWREPSTRPWRGISAGHLASLNGKMPCKFAPLVECNIGLVTRNHWQTYGRGGAA